MPRGLELDWVVVRVSPLRRAIAIGAVGVLAAALAVFAYFRLNLPPDTAARQAIERAERAQQRALEQPLPEAWQSELEQASTQLDAAKAAYGQERWDESRSQAEDARSRFVALVGAGSHELVGVGQFFSLEGRVTVQRSGKAEWTAAHQRMPVFNGDFVKSGRDGTAEILFTDGSLYRIGPNSLLEIHHESLSKEDPGAVKMVVGRINVYTSGSSSTVTTDTSETRIERDSRVSVGVDEGDEETVVETFQGGAVVRNPRGQEVLLGPRERVATVADGDFTAKRRIPEPPTLIEPLNNAGYEMADEPIVELRWRLPSDGPGSHLQVSRSRRFVDEMVDVDAPILDKDWARLRAVRPGTYFWRVATVGSDSVESEWSPVRRFRVHSQHRQSLLADRTPPELVLGTPQQLGHMVIIEGSTEVGATVLVNGESAEMDGDGGFRKALELTQEGWNEIVVTAVDASGNRSERRERVFVEVY